jgi:hypothetical protein
MLGSSFRLAFEAAKLNVAEYRALETLRDRRPIQIRCLGPSDRAALLTAVGQSSPQSLFRRFFSSKRDFTEEEIARYVNVDFVTRVALVAALDEGGREPSLPAAAMSLLTLKGQNWLSS